MSRLAALFAAAVFLVAPISSNAAWRGGRGGPGTGGPVVTVFPGQSGNPVGYAATPANVTDPVSGHTYSNAAWSGSFLTTLTGSQTITGSGTSGSPLVFLFYDVDAQTGGTTFTGNYVTCIGCRFQSNQVANGNLGVTGTNFVCLYCSVVPRVALATSPPNEAWPSASAGLGISAASSSGTYSPYMLNGNNGYQFGINPNPGPFTCDHCDIWGFGNAVNFSTTTALMTVNSSWIHDGADPDAQSYHTDGPGYLFGGNAPSNITLSNDTICSIGNTNAIALQAATSAYSHITITGNYLCGFNAMNDIGHEVVGSTYMVFQNNTIGTDLPWVDAPFYGDPTTLFQQATNSWSGNKISILAGTTPWSGSSPSWTNGQNGYFFWPNGTLNATDFPYLLKRDLDPASNDNTPMWLEKVA